MISLCAGLILSLPGYAAAQRAVENPARPAAARSGSKPPSVKKSAFPLPLSQIDIAAFDKLSGKQIVELNGERTTVQEIRNAIRKHHRGYITWLKSADEKARAAFKEYRTRILEQQLSELKTQNERTAAQVSRHMLAESATLPDDDAATPIWINHAPKEIVPGQLVYAVGKGFGKIAGEFKLVFSDGQEDGTAIDLYHASGVSSIWRDHSIQAAIPSDLAGLTDQPATLEITSQRGSVARWPVKFKASQDVALLESFITTAECSDTAYINACNDEQDMAGGIRASFIGYHYTVGNDADVEGVDSLLISLENGWALDHLEYQVYEWGKLSEGGMMDGVTGCTTECANTKIDFAWRNPADFYAGINYLVHIYLVGPKGVPFR